MFNHTVWAYFKGSSQLQRTDKFQTSKHLKISCQKNVSFPKFPPTFFLESFPPFLMFQPFQTLQVQLHKPTFCIIRSQNFTLSAFFSTLSFPLFQLKIYNDNCTIPISQLQTAFYNCTNCRHFHFFHFIRSVAR